MRLAPLLLTAACLASPAWAQNSSTAEANGITGPGVPAFQVRPGYTVTLAAQNIGEARFLEFGADGTLYVSQPSAGSIATLRPQGTGYQKVADFITNKKSVHGLHFYEGWLWYTQSGNVWKARDTNGDGKADEDIEVLSGLPSGGHWWRSILVTRDGFYTSIGDSGNITDESSTDRQKIWKYTPDGQEKTLIATGIRNTEKLRFRPGTEELWGADHGSDWFGKPLGDAQGKQPITDKIPPCEFNYYVPGGFYGHPFIMGNGMPRLEYKDRPDIIDLAAKTILPAWQLGAHWAPNGFTFVTSNKVGEPGDAFIACHGSWNSATKVGYRVERVLFDPHTGKPYGALPIVSTLSPTGGVLGRPVDCVEAPDGTLLFSDNQGKRIFRLAKTSAGN